MEMLTISAMSLNSSVAGIEDSLKWGYSSRIRATVKRGLILAMKVLAETTPLPVSKAIKLINYTYLLDIPFSIRNLLVEGTSYSKIERRISQVIATVGLINGGLDFVDTIGTFFGSVLDAEKNPWLRVINTYGNAIFLGIIATSLISRMFKIIRIYQLTVELKKGNCIKVVKRDPESEAVTLFKNVLGERAWKAFAEAEDHSNVEVFDFWVKRNVKLLSAGIVTDTLMLGLFVFSPVSGAVLALTSKVLVLASKIFEDYC